MGILFLVRGLICESLEILVCFGEILLVALDWMLLPEVCELLAKRLGNFD